MVAWIAFALSVFNTSIIFYAAAKALTVIKTLRNPVGLFPPGFAFPSDQLTLEQEPANVPEERGR